MARGPERESFVYESGGSRWRRRLLGGPDSWRKVTLTGLAGGVVVAFAAAIIASVATGESESLDDAQPTAIAPAAGDDQPIVEEPVFEEEPVLDEPTGVPVEVPTDIPPTEVFEPEPTFEEPPEPTLEEPPIDEPSAPAGQPGANPTRRRPPR